MKYIYDVYAKTKRGGKASDADKAKVLMTALLFINIAFLFLGAQYITALGIPLIFVILIQIFIYIFVCLQIFRFMVFREQDREVEELDLFLPYYKIRPGFIKMENHFTSYDMYELKNSSYFSIISFKFGRNNEEKAKSTEYFLNKVQDFIHERSLKSRFVIMTENFVESEDASNMLNKANSIKEPRLRATQLSIYNEVLRFSEKNSTAVCIYLMVYAPASFYKEDLEDTIVNILSLYEKEKRMTAFRSLSFLDESSMLIFLKQFYGMAAIDISLSKVQYNMLDSDILKSIIVYRVLSSDGKVYVNPIFDKNRTGVRFLD